MSWKKIVVSGSNISELNNDASYISVTNESDNRIITSTGTGTAEAETNLTFDGSILNVTGDINTTGTVTIGADLIVNGDLTYLNVTDLAVEDQFILLGSGSLSNADKGIIFDNFNGVPNQGVAFYWDGIDQRLSYAEDVNASTTSVTAGAYIPLVFDVDNQSHTPIDANGNIKIEGNEAYIYVV